MGLLQKLPCSPLCWTRGGGEVPPRAAPSPLPRVRGRRWAGRAQGVAGAGPFFSTFPPERSKSSTGCLSFAARCEPPRARSRRANDTGGVQGVTLVSMERSEPDLAKKTALLADCPPRKYRKSSPRKLVLPVLVVPPPHRPLVALQLCRSHGGTAVPSTRLAEASARTPSRKVQNHIRLTPSVAPKPFLICWKGRGKMLPFTVSGSGCQAKARLLMAPAHGGSVRRQRILPPWAVSAFGGKVRCPWCLWEVAVFNDEFLPSAVQTR
eukprot:gene7339-biopygen15079